MTRYFTVFLVFLFFSGEFLYSQDYSFLRNSFVSAKYSYGFVVPHRPDMRYLINDHVKGFEIYYGVKTTGNKIWHSAHNYPKIGMGYFFSELGNPDILGNAHAVFGFIGGKLLCRNRYSLNYNFSLGIGYFRKHFDYQTNHLNFVIGSPLNIYANLFLENRFELNDKIELFCTTGLTHFSNGAIKLPNLGINLINLSGGVTYNINISSNEHIEDETKEFIKIYNFYLVQSFGFQDKDQVNSGKYSALSLSANFGYQTGLKSRFGIGSDLLFREVYKKDYEISGIFDSEPKDYFSSGFHLSYDVIFGDLYFTVQQGLYIYKCNYSDDFLYNRLGFRYKIGEHFLASITLYTHLFIAQNIEAGIGYYFQRR